MPGGLSIDQVEHRPPHPRPQRRQRVKVREIMPLRYPVRCTDVSATEWCQLRHGESFRLAGWRMDTL